MRLHRVDADLAVQRRLQRRMDPAFRDALEVVFTQRHIDDVEAVVTGCADDVAGETEPGQHAVRIVIGSPAEKGDHTRDGAGRKSLAAQLNRYAPRGFSVGGADQQLHLTTTGGHGPEVFLDDAVAPDTLE